MHIRQQITDVQQYLTKTFTVQSCTILITVCYVHATPICINNNNNNTTTTTVTQHSHLSKGPSQLKCLHVVMVGGVQQLQETPSTQQGVGGQMHLLGLSPRVKDKGLKVNKRFGEHVCFPVSIVHCFHFYFRQLR